MLQSVLRYFHTIRYLKSKQVRYRLIYGLRSKFKTSRPIKIDTLSVKPVKLIFDPFIEKPNSFDCYTFKFLNISKAYPNKKPDWNEDQFGLLWAYNLNYFDFILQQNISIPDKLSLIRVFIESYHNNKVGAQPYPTSLRGMNWIKLLSSSDIEDTQIISHLYGQYQELYTAPEYHILGNHLLENAFSLLFAGYFFNNANFKKRAEKILIAELDEQILADGAHFELSPMYHKIILERLLDSINLVQNNDKSSENKLLELMLSKAGLMLSWLKAISFSDDSHPHFNDSTFGIAASGKELFEYAKRLKIHTPSVHLSDSGYRRKKTANYDLILDVGQIGPNYQPGHAHSDTFSFHLNIAGQPFIVDTGISTYEANETRQHERSTAAHNTVQYQNYNQSDVWSAFRVASRANVTQLVEKHNSISAHHNGYRRFNITHQRRFRFSEKQIILEDKMIGNNGRHCFAYLHFAPAIEPKIIKNTLKTDSCIISFLNHSHLSLENYNFALGFNKTCQAKYIKISFIDKLDTVIDIIKQVKG